MAKKELKLPTVERKIHFYRVIETPTEGIRTFQAQQVLALIDQLPFSTGPNGRYLPNDDSSVLCGWPDQLGDLCRVRFGKTRRAALPQVERNGQFSDLNIALDAGLAELIHVVFFPNGTIGADFNFHGPRLSSLAHYLRSKAQVNPTLQFTPLLRSDILEQLNRLENLTLFRLRIKPSLVELIKEADSSLGAAFEASKNMGQSKYIEIMIRPEKDSGQGFLQKIKSMAPKVLQKIENSEKKGAELLNFEVSGQDESDHLTKRIDLLQAHLLTSKQIVKQVARNRVLDSNSAYECIQSAYSELQSQINAASEILL